MTQTFYGHKNSINSLQITENEREIISVDSDGLLKIWDVRTCKELGEVKCGDYSANGVALDPSGDLAFVASDDA